MSALTVRKKFEEFVVSTNDPLAAAKNGSISERVENSERVDKKQIITKNSEGFTRSEAFTIKQLTNGTK